MRKLLTLLLFSLPWPLCAGPAETELFLAGGALELCSDLGAGSCRTAPSPSAQSRLAPDFVFDEAGAVRASHPLLWQRRGVTPPAERRALLGAAIAQGSGKPLSSTEASGIMDDLCVRGPLAAPVAYRCANAAQPRPWRQWLDQERSAVLAAMEVPQLMGGQRRTERAYPERSRQRGGLEVMRAFVEQARRRAPDGIPRIAVVTASSQDPFDPVDFYLSLFDALGAKAQWWPIDAALNAAVAGGRCGGLDELRMQALQLPGRARIYPDLSAQQAQACAAPQALTQVPYEVQGVFFSGGDQWRLRRALVDENDQPNAWLQALQAAHAAGNLVVGGTSAGAAVQSGGAMIGNGTTAEALRAGALRAAPPAPGCDRALACPPGLVEDSFTWWPAGGTGLAVDATADTHFSERGRELRLLTVMLASATPWGYGADETSALRLTARGAQRQLQAYGEHGGWVFERVVALPGGGLEARVHYLAPGQVLDVVDGRLVVPASLSERTAVRRSPDAATDALRRGALREAAAMLARGTPSSLTLRAGEGSVELRRTSDTKVWRGPRGQIGITGLQLSYRPAAERGVAPNAR